MSNFQRMARAVLGTDMLVIVLLTFAWPALWPAGDHGALYQALALMALWVFLAALAAILVDKACKARRT